jgi:hypothetical protein
MLRVTRSSAVKARTQAFPTLHGIVIGSPTVLRDDLVKLSKRALVRRCADLRPETEDLLALVEHPERLHLAAAQRTLRDLAERWLTLRCRGQGPRPSDQSSRRADRAAAR